MKIDFGEEGTATNFLNNKVSWHKQCHQKFNNSMLERAKLKRKRESTETEDEHCRPKRQIGMQRVCMFCDKITKPSYLLCSVRTTNSTVPEGKMVFITSGRFMIFSDVCMCYDYPISL